METLVDFLYQTYILHLWYYLSSFIIILSIIVFIHEGGHYTVAKLCGVKIEEFAIGFGPEVFGINDRSGTRWKLCYIPMGGYVKMFGDVNPASAPDKDAMEGIPPEQEKLTFHGKPLWQKAAIVIAGPAANFLLAIVILTGFTFTYGQMQVPPIIGGVVDGSAAEEAGLQAGDKILNLDGKKIDDFSDVQLIVSINTGTPLPLTYEREGAVQDTVVTPRLTGSKDIFGNEIQRALLGIHSSGEQVIQKEVGFFESIGLATVQTYDIAMGNLKAIGQIVTGSRSVEDLGGPVKIAKYSGQATQMGLHTSLWFIVVISIGLGLINLFPIPVLDGGHLLYYIIEALQGKPLAEKYQEYGMKAGMAFILMMAAIVTFNDIRQLVNS